MHIYDHECPYCEEKLAQVEHTNQWFCNNEHCYDYWGNVYWLEEEKPLDLEVSDEEG